MTSDPEGNLYFIDGNRIRRMSVDSGIIDTVAGGGIIPTMSLVGCQHISSKDLQVKYSRH